MKDKKPYTFKHYINKNLKPLSGEDNIELYPVYGQLIYKRKNYTFNSMVSTYYDDKSSVSVEDRRIMDYEEKLLTEIIDYEIEIKGDKFDVPGFGNKYNHYRRSVVEEARRLQIGNLEHIVNSKGLKYKGLFNFNYEPGKFQLLIEAMGMLMPELLKDKDFLKKKAIITFWEEYKMIFPERVDYGIVFPTVFDWVSGDHYNSMVKIVQYKYSTTDATFLRKYLKEFDSLVKKVTIEA